MGAHPTYRDLISSVLGSEVLSMLPVLPDGLEPSCGDELLRETRSALRSVEEDIISAELDAPDLRSHRIELGIAVAVAKAVQDMPGLNTLNRDADKIWDWLTKPEVETRLLEHWECELGQLGVVYMNRMIDDTKRLEVEWLLRLSQRLS